MIGPAFFRGAIAGGAVVLPRKMTAKSGEGHRIGNSFDQPVAEETQVLTFFEAELR